MIPPCCIKPVTTRIRRSPSRNGARASETEPKINRFEPISENSFFFIVKPPIQLLGESRRRGTRVGSKRYAASARVRKKISKAI